MERVFDIAVVGAGPAGVATVMSILRSMTYRCRVVLLDKARFPRDKICGDAVPYWVFKELEEVCPGIHERMIQQFQPTVFKSTHLHVSKNKSVSKEWSRPGYMIRRTDFDHFLVKQLMGCGDVEIIQEFQVTRIERRQGFFHLSGDQDDASISARFVVGADGAPSLVSRKLMKDGSGTHIPGSAVRTYLTGLNIQDPEKSLIFYNRRFSPGYFWFFPMSHDSANAGFGMINSYRQKKDINLRQAFDHFIQTFPEQLGINPSIPSDYQLKGGFLPFSNGVGESIGRGFAIAGDAAWLNDPLSGDGIRNAVISGILLGKALTEEKSSDNLHNAYLISYQHNLRRRLHRELKIRSWAVRALAKFPFLPDQIVSLNQESWLIGWVKKWI